MPSERASALPSRALAGFVDSAIVLFRFAFGARHGFDVVEHRGEFAQGEAVPCVGLIRVAGSESLALLQRGVISVADFLIPLGVARVSDPLSPQQDAVNRTGLPLEEGLPSRHLWQASEENPFLQRSVLRVHECKPEMSRFAPSGSRLDS
jgi:hypothetical protein